MADPVISALTYTVTDTTIVAVWTTDISADSNLFAGAKAAIDNGVAASGTSHQCIVTGLTPNTVYSCHVVSGATTGSSSNVTTNPSQNRIPILSANNGAIAASAFAPGGGDGVYTFVSSDNIAYITENDTYGFAGTNNGGNNFQLGKITNETTFAGANVNAMSSYGTALNQTDGTDGPSGTALRASCFGPFGLNGHLFMFLDRNNQGGPPSAQWYGNVIRDNGDNGATWNRFDQPATFNANGLGPSDGIYEYAQTYYGFSAPVLYAADDGTLGYNTAGNQIDGANAFVYICFRNNDTLTVRYLMRWPRISFDAMDNSKIEYWKGPTSPTPADFVDDTNWSSSDAVLTAIITTTGEQGDRIFFIPALNRYVMLGDVYTSISNTTFYAYEAPTPAGPWTQIWTANNNPTGWIVPAFFHRDLITNTATDNVPLRMLFSGAFNVPAYYLAHYSTLTLHTTIPVPPTNTFIQGKGTTTTSGTVASLALAFTSNVAAGNLLVVGIRHGTAGTVSSVTDTLLNTWQIVYDTVDSSGTVYGAWAYTFSGGSGANTVTAHFSPSTGAQMAIAEYHGPTTLREASPVTVSVGTTNTSGTSTAIGSLAGDLLIGMMEISAGGASPTPNAGYTLREVGSITAVDYQLVMDILSSAGGAVTTGASNFTAGSWTAGVAAFYATATEYSIAGSAGVAGATVSYTGAASGSVVADASGNYSIPNLYPGAYTITPSLTGYAFTPANSAQTITTANITGVNFTALTVTSIAVNSGNPVSAGTTFSVVVTVSGNVTQNTGVSIATTTGEALGGTTTGTITSGTDSVTFNSMSLAVARTGVIIAATRTSGDFFPTTNSAAFDVVANTVSRANTTALGTTYVNTAFSVRVDSTDGFNNSTPVTQDTAIVLAVGAGTGSIAGGATTGTILSGTSTVTITGVKYSKVENSVELTATSTSGDSIGPLGVDTPFNVTAAPTTSQGPGFGINNAITQTISPGVH